MADFTDNKSPLISDLIANQPSGEYWLRCVSQMCKYQMYCLIPTHNLFVNFQC